MSVVLDLALLECHAQVLASIHNLKTDGPDLIRFVELFRRDFDYALNEDGENNEIHRARIWKRDRARVTTLARAIGAFAEFVAIADANKPDTVGYDHFMASYRLLGPECHDRLHVLRQYCSNVRLGLGSLDDARADHR